MECRVLHHNKNYLEDCANILNEEWKRSLSARLHSLEKSNDKFPINLVMTRKRDGKDVVIGHSRLSIVQGREKSCLIESVVVKKDLRGKGYGRKVMEASEKFAVERGFTTMYLSTHDKQDFYKHLGYSFCQPVVSFGINMEHLPEDFIQKLAVTENKDNHSVTSTSSCDIKANQSINRSKSCDSSSSHSPVAPPPPGAPLPPPPPPPVAKTVSKPEVTRWDTGAISWMKKELT